MTKREKILGLLVGLGVAGAALANGYYPGFPTPSTATSTLPLTGSEYSAFDTGLLNGATPQTENISTAQLRNIAAPYIVAPYAATYTFDPTQYELLETTLTANATLANPANLTTNKTIKYEIIQGGSGSYTLSYGNLFKWPAGTAPTLSTTVGYRDVITCTYDGTYLLCSASLGYH